MSVIVVYLGRKGAGTAYTCSLVSALLNNGIDVLTLISKQNEDKHLFISKNIGIDMVSTFSGYVDLFLFGLPRILGLYSKLLKWIHLKKPKAVVCTMHHIWGVFLGLFLRCLKIPYVFVVHDARLHPGDGNWLHSVLLNLHIKSATRWVALSKNVASCLIEDGCPHSRVSVIPLGLLPYYVAQKPRDITAKEQILVTFFGRILWYKGLDLLLDAWPKVVINIPNALLNVCGSGTIPSHPVLHSHRESIFIKNQWIADSQISQIFSDTDIMVFPYREASQSGVIAIAFPAGIPVVVTPIAGLIEQLQYGGGVVAHSDSADDLSDAIIRLLSNKSLYSHTSAACIVNSKVLDWSEIANQFAGIIK